MNAMRAGMAIARADFLERVRRYSFLVTLVFAVFLGYAAATGKILLLLDDYRGVYTSGWIGTMVSMVTTTFVSLIGFYIVKNAVDRDRTTRVGQILAATPLSKSAYLLGKLASNFTVLASMVAILAAGALTMYFFAGEAAPFEPWMILSPFLFFALPMMALTSAVALLFECLPILRGGFGNILWFFGWSMTMALPAITGKTWLDPAGIMTVMERLRPAGAAAIPGYRNGLELTLNPGLHPKVAEHLLWHGYPWTVRDVFLRLTWIAVAISLVLLATVFFDRFDAARESALRHVKGRSQEMARIPVGTGVSSAVHLTPLGKQASGWRFPAMILGELRLSLKGYRWWWYAIAAGLVIAQLAAPLGVSRGKLLAASWIWPALLWSSMGTRESRYGVKQLLFSSARIVQRQLPASWIAGILVALVTGAGALVRLALAGDTTGLAGALTGAIFVPSLALFLGVATRSSKFFEGLYTVLWYVGPLNNTPGLDFTGASNGSNAGATAAVYLALAIALGCVTFLIRSRQLRHS
jgi:hypothetical protein